MGLHPGHDVSNDRLRVGFVREVVALALVDDEALVGDRGLRHQGAAAFDGGDDVLAPVHHQQGESQVLEPPLERFDGGDERLGGARGQLHTVALRQDGTVWAWGFNDLGQLGDGTTTRRLAQVQVQGLTGVTAIAAGYVHSVALLQDGTAWAWGYNLWGQLGDETFTARSTPVQVEGLTGVFTVTAGRFHTAAMSPEGAGWAWGRNNLGQVGDGTAADRPRPVNVMVQEGT